MTEWTIWSTLIMGVLIGFFATCAGIRVLIYLEDRDKIKSQKSRDIAAMNYARTFNVSFGEARNIMDHVHK